MVQGACDGSVAMQNNFVTIVTRLGRISDILFDPLERKLKGGPVSGDAPQFTQGLRASPSSKSAFRP
jgi:hypothetical protein